MRTVAILFLSVVLVLSSFGVLPVLSIYQNEIKREMQSMEHLSQCSKLVVFNSGQKEIKWADEDKEFSCDGRMYDVQRITDSAGLKYYYCVEDSIENEFIAYKNQLEEHSHQSPSENVVRKIFSLNYILPARIKNQFASRGVICNAIPFPARPSFYSFMFCEHNTPPPRVL